MLRDLPADDGAVVAAGVNDVGVDAAEHTAEEAGQVAAKDGHGSAGNGVPNLRGNGEKTDDRTAHQFRLRLVQTAQKG